MPDGYVVAMAGALRLLSLRVIAGFFAFLFWLPSLALADLVLGLIPAGSESESSHAAGNLAYGIIGAVLVAPAFASQVRRPQQKVAPLQQIAAVALALACVAGASRSYAGVAGAAVVLVPLIVVLALHPALREAFWQGRRPSMPLVVVALVGLVPAVAYAWEMAANGRANLPPEDSYAYVPSVWSATAAMALATVLIALLAARRPPAWPIPAACVAVAGFLFGAASIVNPDVPASGGRGWGAVAILWSLVWVAAATHERKRP
jgi:hypothetical protein